MAETPSTTTTNTKDDESQEATLNKEPSLEESLKAKLNDPATDFSQRDPEGRSLLHQAVLAQADPQLLRDLSERVDLSLRDVHGKTALDLVPADSVLREVVDRKVKGLILTGGEEGEKEAQRLVLAGWFMCPVTAEEAKEKSAEAVRVLEKLVELKGKVEKVHRAVEEGQQEDLKQLLMDDSARLLTAADSSGLLPLHKAVLRRQGEVLKFLVSTSSGSVNVADHMGRTALHYAAALAQDSAELFQTLKEAGADDSLKDLTGKTPADYQQTPDLLPVSDVLKRLAGTMTSSADDKPDDNTTTAVADDSATTTTTSQEALEEQSQQTVQSEGQVPTPTNPTPPAVTGPPKPLQVTPVAMYVPSGAGRERERAPPPTTVDGKYVAQHLGSALTLALAEIAERRPWDPVEYLALWLYKYRQNVDELEKKKALLNEIRMEEEAANAEEVVKFKRREEQLKIQEEERVKREEEEAARRKREQEELQRQAKEALLAQTPQLPTVKEEEAEDGMVRERDEKGQTELHLLAAQSGADLVAVMNLGYSLADRDVNNKTARDIAEEQGLAENVETIDNYVSNLLEQEKLDTLGQLVVEGYDKLDAVLSKVSTEGLPAPVTDFVNSIPQLQEKAKSVLTAVCGGVARDVENVLDRKHLALARDVYGRCPLHLALLAGHQDIAKNLVQGYPLSLKARDNLNRTPLHYAAALSEEMADFLQANGADTSAKDAKQRVPAFYKDHQEEILQLKATLPAGASQSTGETSLPAPQIRADDDNDNNDVDKNGEGQAGDVDRQTKEEGEGQQQGGKEEEESKGSGAAILATTTAEADGPQ